ncbi:MAG: hypothetical protein HY319_02310 [Armatimonadetes bacterium]|nr:hypothetical protein [Armatimonadota bacterium]
MPAIWDDLPSVYRHVFPEFFGRERPEETRATCGNCAMVPGPGAPTSVRFFRPQTRCCTYFPAIPNYLAGGLLGDDSPEMAEGRQRVQARIASRVGVTPRGIASTPTFQLLYNAAPAAFGRAEALKCPYLLPTGCGVWRWRPAVCATWFCKYSTGRDGQLFWKTLQDFLEETQRKLSQYALLELHPESPELLAQPGAGTLGDRDLDGVAPEDEVYRKLWGPWTGREEEFYRQAEACVRGLSPERFQEIMGLDLVLHVRSLEKRLRQSAAPDLPDPLRRNPRLRVERIGGDEYMVESYLHFDPMRLSRRLYELLDEFDGRLSNAEVLEHIRVEKRLRLNDQLLKSLYQARFLIGPGEE